MRELNNPDSHLEYIIKDCEAAIGANPLNPKTEHYLALARACQKELIDRQSKRYFRAMAAIKTDLLEFKIQDRQVIRSRQDWLKSSNLKSDTDNQWTGALDIGLRKLHLTKGA